MACIKRVHAIFVIHIGVIIIEVLMTISSFSGCNGGVIMKAAVAPDSYKGSCRLHRARSQKGLA
jgi:hypothetical protein